MYLKSLGLDLNNGQLVKSGKTDRRVFKIAGHDFFVKKELKPNTKSELADMFVNKGMHDAMWLTDKSGYVVLD